MKIHLKKVEPKEVMDEFLAIAVFQGEKLPFPEITKFLRKDEFEGKLGQTCTISTLGRLNFKKLFLYGFGDEREFTLDYIRRFAGAAVRYATTTRANTFSITISQITDKNITEAVVEGVILASYKCTRFKTKKDELFEIKDCTIIGDVSSESIRHAEILTNTQNYVRALCELPANLLTPQKLAEYAKELAKKEKLSVRVIEKEQLKKLGMNALLAVGQGSTNPPLLILLEYNKNKKNLPLCAVVGKGVMFDSGGISIKPAKGMHTMKYDKSGAIISLGVIKAAAQLNLPLRLLAVIPTVENLPSGSAQKPGDIITAYNGKTIEVLNTDAEGRLILADALAYAVENKPHVIFDVATLTGAMLTSLGRHGIGLFSNDDTLAKNIEAAGKKTYERVWQFPLWKEYSEMIKGDFADIKNMASEVGEASSITAACFLKEFVGDSKWAHLDIASVDYVETYHPYFEKGATGIGMRLIVEALESLMRKKLSH